MWATDTPGGRSSPNPKTEVAAETRSDVGLWVHREHGQNTLSIEPVPGCDERACVRLVSLPGGGREVVHPDDRATLPADALAADSARHRTTSALVSRPVYTPTRDRCRVCHQPFVFTADEQRHWYEVLQIPLERVRVRCRPCRAAERRHSAANTHLGDALRALRLDPDDAAAQLAVATATLELQHAGGGGNLSRAVGLARAAARDPALRRRATDTEAALVALRERGEPGGRRR